MKNVSGHLSDHEAVYLRQSQSTNYHLRYLYLLATSLYLFYFLKKKKLFHDFLLLFLWKKEIFASFEFSAHDFPSESLMWNLVVCRYAHILFVLKENPSRRVNLTPLSTHDWKTRTPSSWSKQCSTRFQISLLESCDKKQLFF